MRSLPWALLAAILAPLGSNAQLLSTAWVELGEGGQAIARVVVNTTGDCPDVDVDGSTVAMTPRTPVPAGYRPVCEAAIPSGAKLAQVKGQTLPLPQADPSLIVVMGDTGCRIKGSQVQNCNTEWPFEAVSKAAAAAKPQLVIHVGDYLYREDPCPASDVKKCGGSPYGFNWDTWNADFFKPAAKLLQAAPWAFSRGNHEDCSRAWQGWFYYLDSRSWTNASCDPTPPPVSIQLGAFQLIELDSSGVSSSEDQGQIQTYAKELSSITAKNAWLVDHHPFWAMRMGSTGTAIEETDNLRLAYDKADPKGIDMVLSGHTHVFELLTYGTKRPLQIVAGDAGTKLEKGVPNHFSNATVYGMMVEQSDNEDDFGYTLLSKTSTGWTLSLRDPKSKQLLNCAIQNGQAKCK